VEEMRVGVLFFSVPSPAGGLLRRPHFSSFLCRRLVGGLCLSFTFGGRRVIRSSIIPQVLNFALPTSSPVQIPSRFPSLLFLLA